MDNYQGDLTDIFRASGGAYGGSSSTGTSSSEPSSSSSAPHHNDHWHHFSSDPMNFSSVLEDPIRGGYFGDPFSTMRDPFLQELDMPIAAGSSAYFNTTSSSSSTTITTTTRAEIITTSSSRGLEDAAASASGFGANTNSNNSSSVFTHKILEDDMRIRPTTVPCRNIFSSMIQISPNAKLPLSPFDSPAAAVVAASPRTIKPSSAISSPRNPGLKRRVCVNCRKNQAKKVVCIPAPAAANSRQTGEVVPSDLWAWRKYGQKPIKGSPYPRGYYRCSSSKGCSARKQVERSRTDPNMLVITYTSEHNHPWPTQRNALAGSTRSQPSKTSGSSSKNSETSHPQKGTTKTKEEQQESNSDGNLSPVVGGNSGNSVKEEMEEIEKQLVENMDDGEFSDGIPYKPSMMESSNQLQSEDFFAELGEIEADPLNLLFTQGFNANDHDQRESKALDPFHLFDWSEEPNNNKRRL
ncbi:probable WRKY transcription factor 35 [Gastrolobium bilobum]|uniref:probable WRKY transcription factor 35 n=1 Tax=Gastrolobium bilobum TaxID=150636 RepID=UPI002AB24451|nr:probable WRKY transcription factor 35 [Gastrolobium bilobum]